jgi:hypothetical protein
MGFRAEGLAPPTIDEETPAVNSGLSGESHGNLLGSTGFGRGLMSTVRGCHPASKSRHPAVSTRATWKGAVAKSRGQVLRSVLAARSLHVDLGCVQA